MRVWFGLVSVAGLFAAHGAFASVPLTTTVSTTSGAATGAVLSATATGANASASVLGGTGLSLVPLSRFNPNTGILLGARLTASVPVSVTTSVSGTGISGGGAGGTIAATATYAGAVSASGVSIGSSQIVASRSCTGGNCRNSPGNDTSTTTGTIAGTAAVGSGSLASYYGAGSVNVATAGNLTAAVQKGANVTTGVGTAQVARTGTATYSIAYDYINFSQPSFSGNLLQTSSTIDFGSRVLNSNPFTINFSLFNLGNANSAGFDLLSVTRDTGESLFSTTLLPFSNGIAGGASRSFAMTLTPSSLGSKFDTFRLRVRDSAADVGTGVGAREYDLMLSVMSFVVLPDPGTWMSMIAGFGLVGGMMRRRRTLAAA